MDRKIAIVIGHNERAQGAVRATDGRSEYDWNGELAEMIKDHAPANVYIFRRDASLSYSEQIRRVYAAVDSWGAHCSIELHFNALNASASGGLTLTSGSAASRELALEVRSRSAAALGNGDRGLVVRSKNDRGGLSLHSGKAPAILTEPYFGSNPAECDIADARMADLAEAVFNGAAAFVGLERPAVGSPAVALDDRPPAASETDIYRWRIAELRKMAQEMADLADETLKESA